MCKADILSGFDAGKQSFCMEQKDALIAAFLSDILYIFLNKPQLWPEGGNTGKDALSRSILIWQNKYIIYKINNLIFECSFCNYSFFHNFYLVLKTQIYAAVPFLCIILNDNKSGYYKNDH